jgi:hypothetical protein
MEVTFVSYNGRYPNACSGTLVVSINGKLCSYECRLESGGGLTDDYDTYHGPWTFFYEGVSEELARLITEVINQNVPMGCCGGCV